MKEIEAIRAALDSEVKGYGNLNHVWGADKDEDGIFWTNIVGANVDGDLYPVLEIDTAQYFQEEDGPKLAKYYAACNPDAMAAVLAHIDEQAAEIERLTECLKKANAQTEHFEREWYLRGDEIERLRAELESCTQYLKDDETVAECIERNRRDADAAVELLRQARAERKPEFALELPDGDNRKLQIRWVEHRGGMWHVCVLIDEAQPERKPHTEAEVQEIIGSALREFGVFEATVRDVLGVPKP